MKLNNSGGINNEKEKERLEEMDNDELEEEGLEELEAWAMIHTKELRDE